nr:hypothetical protein 1634Bnrm2_p083 [Cryptomonas sp.]
MLENVSTAIDFASKSIGCFDLSANLVFNVIKKDAKFSSSKILIFILIHLIYNRENFIPKRFDNFMSFYITSQSITKTKKGISFFDFYCIYILKIINMEKKYINVRYFRIFSKIFSILQDICSIDHIKVYIFLSTLINSFMIKSHNSYSYTIKAIIRFQKSGEKTDFINSFLIKIYFFTNNLQFRSFMKRGIIFNRFNFGFCFRKSIFEKYKTEVFIIHCRIQKKKFLITKSQKKFLFLNNKIITKVLMLKNFLKIKFNYSYFCLVVNFTNKKEANYNQKVLKLIDFSFTVFGQSYKDNYLLACKFPYFTRLCIFDLKLIKNSKTNLNNSKTSSKKNPISFNSSKWTQNINFLLKLVDFRISDLKFLNKMTPNFLINNSTISITELAWTNLLFDWISDILCKKKKKREELQTNFARTFSNLINNLTNTNQIYGIFRKNFRLLFSEYFEKKYSVFEIQTLEIYLKIFSISILGFFFEYNFRYYYVILKLLILNKNLFRLNHLISLYLITISYCKERFLLRQKYIYTFGYKYQTWQNIEFHIFFYVFILKKLNQENIQNLTNTKNWPYDKNMIKIKISFKNIFFGIVIILNSISKIKDILSYLSFIFFLKLKVPFFFSIYFLEWIDSNENRVEKILFRNKIKDMSYLLEILYTIFDWIYWAKIFFCSLYWKKFSLSGLNLISLFLNKIQLNTLIEESSFRFISKSIIYLAKYIINLLLMKKYSLLKNTCLFRFSSIQNRISLESFFSLNFFDNNSCFTIHEFKKKTRKRRKYCWKIFFQDFYVQSF